MIIGIPLIAFIIPLLFFGYQYDGLIAYWPKWKVAIFFTVLYWVIMRGLVLLFRAKLPEYKDTGKRIVLMVLSTFLLVAVINSFCYEIHDWLLPEEQQHELTKFEYGRATLIVVLLILSIYEAVYLYHRWRLSLLETEQLRRENIQSQLEGLKNQVNPHFLFNSLNTLAYLIPEDEQRAVRFVQQLSKVYRYILEIRDMDLISLAEELDFLESYRFLLRERFGENLQVEIRVDPALHSMQMIPLSLQMLFENAIKHNIISRDQPLFIEVTDNGRSDSLLVRNRIQLKDQVQASTKVGLDNIRRRYLFYTSAEVQITEDDTWFEVRLPLLYTRQVVAEQNTYR